ncbi:MAG: hypothetical protein IJ759_00090 [Bacteroidales bacterium]|nr:hypothetical protein [Bacteroidales bacterium]
MTVKELIEYLQTLKQDCKVAITNHYCSRGELIEDYRYMSTKYILPEQFDNTYLFEVVDDDNIIFRS